MTAVIIGIDISKDTAYFATRTQLSPKLPAWIYQEVKTRPISILASGIDAALRFATVNSCGDPIIPLIEHPYVGVNPKSTEWLVRSMERINVCFELRGIKTASVQPKQWHSLLIQSGHVPIRRAEIKKASRWYVHRVLGLPIKSQDLCDAICIAEWGHMQVRAGIKF